MTEWYTCTSDDSIHWGIYASPGFIGLSLDTIIEYTQCVITGYDVLILLNSLM